MTIEKPARLALALALIFTLYMALSPNPMATPIDRFGDKFEHMTAFGTLAVMARLAFARMPALRILERLSFFGALIEVFQAIPALHRDCDWHDWVADTLALAIALALFELVSRAVARGRKAGNEGNCAAQ
jgi:hypothetical protein